ETHLAGECRQRVAERGAVRVQMVGELDIEALAEYRAEPRERLACGVEVARANRPRHSAVGTPGEPEEAPRVLGAEADSGPRRRREGCSCCDRPYRTRYRSSGHDYLVEVRVA